MNTNQHRDLDAEQAVIGAVLLDVRVLASLPDVEPADFSTGEHHAIWAAIRNLEADARPIDHVTIGDEVERWARLRRRSDHEDDSLAFRSLCDLAIGKSVHRCPVPDRAIEYAEILRRHRLTRDCVKALGSLQSVAANGSLEGDELIAEAAGELMRLGERKGGEDPGRTVGQIIATECKQIAADQGREGIVGIPTGLVRLDALTGGLPLAVMTLILARPGMGKTTLMHNMAWCAAALLDEAPLVYTYEDSLQSFAQRSMAQSSGVPTERIRARNFRRQDLDALAASEQCMLSRREVIVHAPGMTVDELIRDARARRMRTVDGKRTGRVVFVDYVQKMPAPEGRTRNEQIGAISRKLSEWASRDGIALVAGCQLNRSVESRDDHVPRMDDIRDCGELEQDGKLMLGLYRPAKYDEAPTGENGRAPDGLLEIHVLKNHNGQTERHASVFWDLETHTIVDNANDLKARRLLGGSNANGN